jgi:hypothetical protein
LTWQHCYDEFSIEAKKNRFGGKFQNYWFISLKQQNVLISNFKIYDNDKTWLSNLQQPVLYRSAGIFTVETAAPSGNWKERKGKRSWFSLPEFQPDCILILLAQSFCSGQVLIESEIFNVEWGKKWNAQVSNGMIWQKKIFHETRGN